MSVVRTDLGVVAADHGHSLSLIHIFSTRPSFIRRGRELGLFTILRFFVFDSLSLENVRPAAAAAQPDMVEILPGIMPKVISRIAAATRIPLICGGLIMDKNCLLYTSLPTGISCIHDFPGVIQAVCAKKAGLTPRRIPSVLCLFF